MAKKKAVKVSAAKAKKNLNIQVSDPNDPYVWEYRTVECKTKEECEAGMKAIKAPDVLSSYDKKLYRNYAYWHVLGKRESK